MVNKEPVLFDEYRIAHLEYSPLEIKLLETMDRKQQFFQGEDFEIDEHNGTLTMTRASAIPSLRLVGGTGIGFDRFITVDGLSLFFSEGPYIHDNQLLVTYSHRGEKKVGKCRL